MRTQRLCLCLTLSILIAPRICSGGEPKKLRWLLPPESPWTQLSVAAATSSGGNEKRFGLAAGVIGGDVYAIGGTNGFKPLSTVRHFNPKFGAWRDGPPMPTPRSELAVAASGGILFAIGGASSRGASDAVEAFDPKTGRWEKRAAMPTPRRGLSVAVLDGLIYAAGGRDVAGSVAAVEVYDPRKNLWLKKSPLPTAVETRQSFIAVDGILYLFGGRGGKSCLRKVQAYNPESDAWAVDADLPTADCYLSVAAHGDAIFAFGGIHRTAKDTSAATLVYFPKTGQWRNDHYAVPFMENFALAGAGGKFYLMGGKINGSAETPLRIFDPALGIKGPTTEMRVVTDYGVPPPEHSPSKTEPPVAGIAAAGVVSDVDGYRGTTNSRPNDFALVIGIEKYRSISDAQFAERDADTFHQYARTVLGVPKDNVILLLNEHASQADLSKYLEEWLPRNVGPDSRVYVYYSGHGTPDVTGKNSYIVPWDGDPSYLKSRAYPLSKLYKSLDSLRAKEVVVLLDACFSGTGPRSLVAKGLRPLVVVTQTPVPHGGRLTVLTASSADEAAGTMEGQGHGMFTYFLLKGLKDSPFSKKGEAVKLEDLYRYLREQVPAAARRQNREQTPQMFTSNAAMTLY